MKYLFSSILTFFACTTVLAQGDSFGNPMLVSPECYPEMTNNVVPSFGTYNLAAGDDFYFSFVAEHKSIKINVDGSTPASLNANIELKNDLDVTIATAAETTLWYSDLTAGQTYFIRISDVGNDFGGTFTIQIEDVQDARIKDSYVPSLALFDSMDGHVGYRVSNNIRRTEGCDYVAEASKWYLYDTGNTFLAEYTVLGPNSSFNLENFNDFLCFGNSYSIAVEVQIEGVWLGTSAPQTIDMEPVPFANITTLNSVYEIDNGDFISCENIGSGNTIEWEISSQNNEDIYTVFQSSTFLYLNTIECLLDNAIYSIRTRSTYCGQVGPWTDSFTFETSVMPTSVVNSWNHSTLPDYQPLACPASLPANSTLRSSGYVRADQYTWQFTPITPGDPTMTPIGLPIVLTGSSYAIALQTIQGIEVGSTYRVGVKWAHGLDGGCIAQESDYGTFCEITIDPPMAGTNPTIDLVSSNIYNLSSSESTFSKPQFYNVNKSFQIDESYSLTIYDLTGRIVYNDSEEKYSVEDINHLATLSLRGNFILVYKNNNTQQVVHRYFN